MFMSMLVFSEGKLMFLKMRTSILERQIARKPMQYRKEAARRRVKQPRPAQKRARETQELRLKLKFTKRFLVFRRLFHKQLIFNLYYFVMNPNIFS